jgi:purine-nucleoside phosphorylase
MNETTQQVLQFQESLSFIQNKFGFRAPDATLVLGSGLGDIVNLFEIEKSLSYSEIPHFPKSHVQGHSGTLHIGSLHGKRILVFSGRYHSYQGLPNSIAALPAWIASFWKIPTFIATNASGGIKSTFKTGSIALIKDHLFLQTDHPLRGVMLPGWENPFCDMTHVYDDQLRKDFTKAGTKTKLKVFQGTYVCLNGPTYETPAEIQMFKKLGADMVGMSTIPEIIIARKMGLKILGISMVANVAAGLGGKKQNITHHEVVDSIQKAQVKLGKLLSEFFKTSRL